jgi:hypothetical protein
MVAPHDGAGLKLVPHVVSHAGTERAYNVAGRKLVGARGMAPELLLIRRHFDSDCATPVLRLE